MARNALNESLYKMMGRPTTWVLAASDSKDATEIFRPLVKSKDKVVLVEFGPVDGMPWVKPMPMQKLEEALTRALEAAGHGPAEKIVHAGDDVFHALQEATEMPRTEDGEGPLVIAGSLYLVGDVLRLLRNARKDSDVTKT